MTTCNPHFQKLTSSYLFPKIEEKKKEFSNPELPPLDLGIGDITLPLLPSVLESYKAALDEMSQKPVGYGPSQGYLFLRKAISDNDYKNLLIHPDEIFISNGAKCDCAHLLELFSSSCTVALCDPAYPVYVDSTVISGKTGEADSSGKYAKIVYLPLTEENGFMPHPPETRVDIVYLCSPNNPTGVALTRPVLKKWVDFAKASNTILIYDGAYEAFITDDCPHSIYEIEGAKDVAIEIRSYSKTAGFTGLRCSYTVIPKQLKAAHKEKDIFLHALWKRRQDTKFGGLCYLTQKATVSLYSTKGKQEVFDRIQIYKRQTETLKEGLIKLGFTVYGGSNAPYLWVKVPKNYTSWSYFEHLLKTCQIIGIPGRGFGPSGEGFIRFSAFGSLATINQALSRLSHL